MNDAQLVGRVLDFLEYPSGPTISYNQRDEGEMFVRVGGRRVTITDTDMVLRDGAHDVAFYPKDEAYLDRACEFLAGKRKDADTPPFTFDDILGGGLGHEPADVIDSELTVNGDKTVTALLSLEFTESWGRPTLQLTLDLEGLAAFMAMARASNWEKVVGSQVMALTDMGGGVVALASITDPKQHVVADR